MTPITETELADHDEYGSALCLNQNGGEVPGRRIKRLVEVARDQQRTIDDLRKPMVIRPECIG